MKLHSVSFCSVAGVPQFVHLLSVQVTTEMQSLGVCVRHPL